MLRLIVNIIFESMLMVRCFIVMLLTRKKIVTRYMIPVGPRAL